MSDVAMRTTLPRNVSYMLIAILGAGFAAAQMVSPILWWTTAAMAALVVLGWRQSTRNQHDANADPAELPTRTRRVVGETFAEIENTASWDLLREVVQRARTLYAAAESNDSLSGQLLDDCAELVEVSCATACELQRIDQLLAPTAVGQKPAGSDSVRSALEISRDLFRRRLGDAADALGQLYVQSVQRGTMSSDRVAELAAELSAEVSVRKRVSAEMNALLE